MIVFFFFQAEDGIRDKLVTGVQTCALPISGSRALRVAWMYQDSPFGAELYRGFAERVKDANLPIEAVAAERFRVGETDYRSEERRVGKEGRSRWSPYH